MLPLAQTVELAVDGTLTGECRVCGARVNLDAENRIADHERMNGRS